MARQQLAAPSLGYIDKRRVGKTPIPTATISPEMYAAARSLSNLDAAILAAEVGYTQKQLDGMTLNDKVYIARTLFDATSLDIKDPYP